MNAASAAPVTAPSYATASSVSAISPKVAGLCGAAAGLAALAALLLRSKPQADSLPLTSSIAMAAASGERATWFPGAKAPPHLTGQYPADRGFDPVDFAVDPIAFDRMRASEVFHGRLAMLGVAGCLIPELLGKPVWFQVGESVNLAQLGLYAMFAIAPVEYWRGNGGFGWPQGERNKGNRIYPGFDPLNLTNDDTKTKEIKNGRLAMIAFVGLASQANSTGVSPFENLAAATGIAAPVAMFATAGKREVWLPGAQAPAHLTGEYPADRGFDPIGLSKDPATFERMRCSEVFHGRLAMLGVVGSLLPELQGKGAWYEIVERQWGPGPTGEVIGIYELGLIGMLFTYPLEYWRGNGGFGWGEQTGDRNYPGFDPLGLTTFDTKVAEIKNGRLAMLATLGFAVQHAATGGSPLDNWAAATGATAMFATTGAKDC